MGLYPDRREKIREGGVPSFGAPSPLICTHKKDGAQLQCPFFLIGMKIKKELRGS